MDDKETKWKLRRMEEIAMRDRDNTVTEEDMDNLYKYLAGAEGKHPGLTNLQQT